MGLRSLLTGSVAFQAKHPVLRGVTLLLLVVPAFLDHAMRRMLAVEDPLLVSDGPAWQQPLLLGTLLVLLLTTIVELWGIACILVTSRRLLGHPAGRSRRALLALMREGAGHVPALFLTSILRTCTAILLLLPAILVAMLLLWNDAPLWALFVACGIVALPAVLYVLRTAFFAVVIVCEGERFRSALQRSAGALQGRLLQSATRILLVMAVTLGPTVLLDELLVLRIPSEELSLRALLADGLISAVEGVGMLLCTVALTLLYASLRSHTVTVARVAKKTSPSKKKRRKS